MNAQEIKTKLRHIKQKCRGREPTKEEVRLANALLDSLEEMESRGVEGKETRATFNALEMRATGKTIVGLVPFNSPSEDLGGYVEVILPGAFKDTLAAGHDILSFWNHDSGMVLGSTRAGTLKLKEKANGLHISLVPPNNSWGADALESVRRRDTAGFSFSFNVGPDGEGWKNGVRYLNSIDLREVSPTAIPAYSGSQAAVRSKRRTEMEDQRNIDQMSIEDLEHELQNKRTLASFQSDTYKPPKREAGFASMGEFLQSVQRAHSGGGVDRRLENRYLSESVGSSGGFLVAPQFVKEIMENVWNEGEIMRRCWQVPMQSNQLKIPGVDETSRADGSRGGGLRGFWVAEGGTKTESEPSFRMIELNLKKCVVLVPATDELLQDAAALDAFVRSYAEKEIKFTIENAIFNGSGVGMPLGILNAGATVEVSKQGGQSSGTIVYENILDMYARLREDTNAAWFVDRSCIPQLATMSLSVGTGGSAVWMPANGAAGQPYNTLLGIPVIIHEHGATVGTVGDICLCDMSKYILASRPIEAAMSIHVYFVTDKSLYRFVLRIDSQPILASPITPKSGGDTVSDFVTLESRT